MESNPVQLDGWADIAAHLGVSPQTARELEDRLALPVRRMRTPGGEIVYAFTGELDEWRGERGALLVALPPPAPLTADTATAPWTRQTISDRRRSRLRSWLGEALMLFAAIAGFAAWRWLSPPRLASVTIEGPVLVARDGAGRTLWSYETGDVRHTGSPGSTRASAAQRPIVRDLDGDSRPEVLTVVPGDTLVCLSGTGDVRWRYTPGALVVGAHPANQPWRLTNVVVGKAGPTGVIWSAWTRGPDGPAIVVRLDPSGHGLVALPNTGTHGEPDAVTPR